DIPPRIQPRHSCLSQTWILAPFRPYCSRVRSTSQPGANVADPEVAATVRLMHRRHGWGLAAITSFLAFALGYGAIANGNSEGAAAPSWFVVVTTLLLVLTVIGIIVVVVYSVLLRRR